jgi:hypothetical protein
VIKTRQIRDAAAARAEPGEPDDLDSETLGRALLDALRPDGRRP